MRYRTPYHRRQRGRLSGLSSQPSPSSPTASGSSGRPWTTWRPQSCGWPTPRPARSKQPST
eukprot:1192443-Pyramimonas_sp.AAC.1